MPVILSSGGIDSTVLFYSLAKHPLHHGEDPNEEIVNVVVDFGQVCYAGSVANVKYHQQKLGKGRLLTLNVDIPLAPEVAAGPIFDPKYDVEDGREPLESDYINGRNTILIAQAAALASMYDMLLYVGFHIEKFGDTDRSPDFLAVFTDLQYAGGFRKATIRKIVAPFMDAEMDKSAVVNLGFELGVEFDHTNSCTYKHPACGKCGICKARPKWLEEGRLHHEGRHPK